MKLLYLVNALAIHGGLERIITDKVNWLAEHTSYEIHVWAFSQGKHPMSFALHPRVVFTDLALPYYEQYHYTGWRRTFYTIKNHFTMIRELKKRLAELSPDCIVCLKREHAPYIDKARGSVPFIYESHSIRRAGFYEHYDFKQRLKICYYERYLRNALQIVALTEGDASEWRKLSSRVTVIPNMVHLNASDTYSDHLSKKAIFVGRYGTQKDIGSLFQVWKMVNKRHPDWQLHLYGGHGNQNQKWQDQQGLEADGIFVHPPTSRIDEKYVESSMLLLTSRYEPFGLVLPEAMSYGLPVVAFDAPYGPADIITDGVDGFLIKGRDIEAFADKVCLLIENTELRRQMGQAAIRSSQRYHASVIMPGWTKFFDKLFLLSE